MSGFLSRPCVAAQGRISESSVESKSSLVCHRGTESLQPLAVGHAEAARLIGVSVRKLHTMVKDREVVPCRLGGRNVYLVDDLRAYLESKKVSSI
jgi:hypothetical protein